MVLILNFHLDSDMSVVCIGQGCKRPGMVGAITISSGAVKWKNKLLTYHLHTVILQY